MAQWLRASHEPCCDISVLVPVGWCLLSSVDHWVFVLSDTLPTDPMLTSIVDIDPTIQAINIDELSTIAHTYIYMCMSFALKFYIPVCDH